jgi:tripartite-type tricarboxylate transporter receptor subunit TctC
MRIASALMILITTAVSASAQGADPAWPSKPIRFIVPFPAGSSTDVVGRIVAQMLSTRLGQQVVIDNRAGASGNIGMEAVTRAAPDGYTLGMATLSTHALAPSLSVKLPYDPIKDFAPVAMIGSAPYVMVTYPGLGPASVQDFVTLAKTRPGKLNYGSAGPASLAHLAGVMFANGVGAQLIHVPYKSSAQSVTDLITGRLDMQFATIAPTLPLIRNGQLRALATTGEQRSGTLPELPTIAESGIAGYEASLWMAIVMPPATPLSIVARLNKELIAMLSTNEGKNALLAQGVDAQPGTPESLRTRIAADIEKWKAVITKAGIQPE